MRHIVRQKLKDHPAEAGGISSVRFVVRPKLKNHPAEAGGISSVRFVVRQKLRDHPAEAGGISSVPRFVVRQKLKDHPAEAGGISSVRFVVRWKAEGPRGRKPSGIQLPFTMPTASTRSRIGPLSFVAGIQVPFLITPFGRPHKSKIFTYGFGCSMIGVRWTSFCPFPLPGSQSALE